MSLVAPPTRTGAGKLLAVLISAIATKVQAIIVVIVVIIIIILVVVIILAAIAVVSLMLEMMGGTFICMVV